MSHDITELSLSALDEARFGIRTVRRASISREDLPGVLEFCERERVKFLIARCPVADLPTVQALEARGFFLTDTLVHWARDLRKTPLPAEDTELAIRPFRPGDEAAVLAIAAASFRGYFGHYHADPRLDRAQCDATYTDWAMRSCADRSVATEVFVAEDAGEPVGFGTWHRMNAEEGEWQLAGVAPSAQNRGVYRRLMIRVMHRMLAHDCGRLVTSTQINNLAVQKVWARLGCEPSHAYYTFHKWFD